MRTFFATRHFSGIILHAWHFHGETEVASTQGNPVPTGWCDGGRGIVYFSVADRPDRTENSSHHFRSGDVCVAFFDVRLFLRHWRHPRRSGEDTNLSASEWSLGLSTSVTRSDILGLKKPNLRLKTSDVCSRSENLTQFGQRKKRFSRSEKKINIRLLKDSFSAWQKKVFIFLLNEIDFS